MKGEERSDRRSRRTQELLRGALVALMLEKRYDAITVQDILDRANVGRSTFYAHYLDKEDLLLGSVEHLLQRVIPHGEPAGADGVPSMVELFRHVQENHDLYKAMVWGQRLDLFLEKGQRVWADAVEAQLVRTLGDRFELLVPPPVLAQCLIGTLFTLLRWWADNKMPYTPEEMDAMYHRFVVGGLGGAGIAGA
jgi:AcrR family transcriptional regulator